MIQVQLQATIIRRTFQYISPGIDHTHLQYLTPINVVNSTVEITVNTEGSHCVQLA